MKFNNLLLLVTVGNKHKMLNKPKRPMTSCFIFKTLLLKTTTAKMHALFIDASKAELAFII